MRTGCCPDQESDTSKDTDGTVGRHLIRTNEYKNAIDEDGNHQSGGVERDVPWVAITPVVNAIRVLERMVPRGSLLFDHRAHDVRHHRPGTGSLKPDVIRRRIEDFVGWANAEATAHNRPGETIPADPHGGIGTARFRRSLAWHIARRPNGLVALAIQYGHLRTAVSGSYASRGRGGIHELLDMETVRAVADTVADLHDNLASGGGVSGPAARRAIKAATTAPRFAGTIITARTARRLLANEDAMIYDNPQAFLLCHYKHAQALCHRDGVKDTVTDTPSLDHCVPGCGNAVRTDRHAAALRDRADLLDKRASHAPHPVAERLRANAPQAAWLRRQSRPDPHHRRGQGRMSPSLDERDRIRAAMDRILTGAAQNSSGALTIVALAHEAGVPRNALTQRHIDLKTEFYARVTERAGTSEVEARLRQTITRLKKTIANKNVELDQLRADLPALVRAVNVLTLENRQLREAVEHPAATVVPFRPRHPPDAKSSN